MAAAVSTLGMFTKLAYVDVDVPNLAEWDAFMEEIFGAAPIDATNATSRSYRLNDRSYALRAREGANENGLALMGWELPNREGLDAAKERLDRAGVTWRALLEEQLLDRGVTDGITFADNSNVAHEFVWGSDIPGGSAQLSVDDIELGHVLIAVPRLDESVDFYSDAMGLRLSSYMDANGYSAAFMRSSLAEHAIAFFSGNKPGMLNHLMVEMASLDDVGRVLDRCLKRGLATTTLGRHVNDNAISFYMHTPANFDIECGWGTLDAEDETWTVRRWLSESVWGHQPLSAN